MTPFRRQPPRRPEPNGGARCATGIIADGAREFETPITFDRVQRAGKYGCLQRETGRPHARVMPSDGRRAEEAQP